MKANTAHAIHHQVRVTDTKPSVVYAIKAWIREKSPVWEENRIGITATAIFLQVTIAAVMICLAGMSGGSPFAFGAGILFAFLADSLVLAQSPMRWIIGMMAASIIVNISLAVYFAAHLA